VEIIETIEDWNDLAKTLKEFDYSLVQMQYGIEYPEGFHVWFSVPGTFSRLEVVTHSEKVAMAIMEYRPDWK